MASSQRDKTTMIWICVVLVLFLVYYFVGSPLLASIDTLNTSLAQAKKTYDDNLDTLVTKSKNQKTWDAMVNNGLKKDEQTAEQQMLQALQDWQRDSGITVDNQRQMRTTQDPKKQFSIIGFDVQATGTMRSVDHYLWAIETSPLPIQMNECNLSAVKDGQDTVTMRVQVTAICEPPAGSKPAPQPPADSAEPQPTGGNP